MLYAEVDEDDKLILDSTGAPVWDEEDSLDMLDQLEDDIADLVIANQTRQNEWRAIEYAGPSETSVQEISGIIYQAERISLRFKVF